MKRYFLYVFLLIFIVGFLFLTGFFSLNKIKSFFSNLNIFTATVAPDSLSFESSEVNLSAFAPDGASADKENLLTEKEPVFAEGTSAELGRSPTAGKEENQEIVIVPKPLTLAEIQEIIDDITERIDIISQEISELVGESQQTSEEITEDAEEVEEPEEELEKEEEELEEKLEEEKKEKKKPKRRSTGGGGSSPPKPSYPKILVSELQISGQDDEKEEFVELYNPNGTDIELTNWYVQRKTAEGSSFSTFAPSKLFSGKTIRAKDYFLIARENSSFTDLADIIIDYPLTENNTLVLKDPNREIKDKVGWGEAQDFETAPAKNPLAGQSLGRKWNLENQEYQDKDNNSEDFEIQKPTPKVENSPLPLPQPILEVSLEIIEFSIIEFDTASQSKIFTPHFPIESEGFTISNIGEGILEWESIIEYATPSFNGTGWLEIEPNSGLISTDTPSEVLVFPDISNLVPRIYSAKIITTASAAEGVFKEIKVNLNVVEKIPEDTTPPEVVFNHLETTQTSLSFTISWSGIDPIGNATPSGLEAFYLQYSIIDAATPGLGEILQYQDEVKGWQDWEIGEILELGEQKDNLVLLGKDEHTYYFQIQAKDASGNESEWQEVATTINLPKTVLINEIQIDSQEGVGGTKDDWTELYNPNDFDISLIGWSIQEHSSCSTNVGFYKKNFPEGAVIPTQRFFLIVDTEADESLKNIADMTIGWSLTDNNTVYLVKNQEKIENGEDLDIIDKVGFGQSCFSEGNPAPNPPESKSIERKELGVDTDDNNQDFKINNTPTPTNSRGEDRTDVLP